MSYTNYMIAAVNAEGYYQTAQMIKDRAKNPINIEPFLKFSNPYIIILSLACEFYLKSMLLYHNIDFPKTGGKGHNLFELYKQLNHDDQEEINKAYASEVPLEDFLSKHEKIFVDRRYPYERANDQEKNQFSYEPFEEFSKALATACVVLQRKHLDSEACNNAGNSQN